VPLAQFPNAFLRKMAEDLALALRRKWYDKDGLKMIVLRECDNRDLFLLSWLFTNIKTPETFQLLPTFAFASLPAP
jgi:hypothetical protein